MSNNILTTIGLMVVICLVAIGLFVVVMYFMGQNNNHNLNVFNNNNGNQFVETKEDCAKKCTPKDKEVSCDVYVYFNGTDCLCNVKC